MLRTMLLTAVAALAALCGVAADGFSGNAHIEWDVSSRTVVFSHGVYSRMIRLHDGRLLAVCEHAGINVAFSSDGGRTWGAPVKIVPNAKGVPNCAPDLIQLRDGTIIVAYNPRPSAPYSPERRFGIRCRRSTDGGLTWSGEIFVNDAGYEFGNGCWEPSMLELPSGELQLYFADEGPYTASDEQQISVCRSYDGGLTWNTPSRVSFRASARDGMPVPVLLSDGRTIVVAIEDNGWPGVGDFLCTTVRCDTVDNWRGIPVLSEDTRRACAFVQGTSFPARGGAPYLRVLPSGLTVLSWQSTYRHGSSLTMYTAVGDEHARNFGGVTVPFVTDTTSRVVWNSLAVADSGCVIAVGGVDGRIEMIRGRVVEDTDATVSVSSPAACTASTSKHTIS